MQLVQAYRTLLLAVDAELEKELESNPILVIKSDDILLLQDSKEVRDAGSGELPVAAHLAQSKKNLEEYVIANLSLASSCRLHFPDFAFRIGPGLVSNKSVRYISNNLQYSIVLLPLILAECNFVHILRELGQFQVHKLHILLPSQAERAHD